MLSPDLYYRSVYDIDLEELAARGVDTLFVDLDNTLTPRNSDEIPEATMEWARSLEGRGFSACLVSNNWHDRVVGVAEELGFEIVPKALKPLPFAFWRAMRLMGSKAEGSAIVGDQLFTDVLGGKLTGITTVLVGPMTASDLPHTLLLRKLEHFLLAGRQPLP